MSLSPKIWGPSAWRFLHSITFSYPVDPTVAEQDAAIKFFNSLALVLACSRCRHDFADLLKARPVEAAVMNRESLTRWLYDIHEQVNLKLHKPRFSFAEAERMYGTSDQCQQCAGNGKQGSQNSPYTPGTRNGVDHCDPCARLSSGSADHTNYWILGSIIAVLTIALVVFITLWALKT